MSDQEYQYVQVRIPITKQGRPSIEDIAEYISSSPSEKSAMDILEYFMYKGYRRKEVQNAMQSGLSKGFLDLGPKLNLVVSTPNIYS